MPHWESVPTITSCLQGRPICSCWERIQEWSSLCLGPALPLACKLMSSMELESQMWSLCCFCGFAWMKGFCLSWDKMLIVLGELVCFRFNWYGEAQNLFISLYTVTSYLVFSYALLNTWEKVLRLSIKILLDFPAALDLQLKGTASVVIPVAPPLSGSSAASLRWIFNQGRLPHL